MIETLLGDKQALQQKMDQMAAHMKDQDGYLERQRKVIEEKFNVEMKKNKEAWMASEKVRREKWEKEKIHEIRAQTVKGLEPEI